MRELQAPATVLLLEREAAEYLRLQPRTLQDWEPRRPVCSRVTDCLRRQRQLWRAGSMGRRISDNAGQRNSPHFLSARVLVPCLLCIPRRRRCEQVAQGPADRRSEVAGRHAAQAHRADSLASFACLQLPLMSNLERHVFRDNRSVAPRS